MWGLNWKFKSLSSPFSFPTFSTTIRSSQIISLYVLVWQKCAKVPNTWSPKNLPSLSICLEESKIIFCISLLPDHTVNHQCSLTTGNTVISTFISSQTRQPIPEIPASIQNPFYYSSFCTQSPNHTDLLAGLWTQQTHSSIRILAVPYAETALCQILAWLTPSFLPFSCSNFSLMNLPTPFNKAIHQSPPTCSIFLFP